MNPLNQWVYVDLALVVLLFGGAIFLMGVHDRRMFLKGVTLNAEERQRTNMLRFTFMVSLTFGVLSIFAMLETARWLHHRNQSSLGDEPGLLTAFFLADFLCLFLLNCLPCLLLLPCSSLSFSPFRFRGRGRHWEISSARFVPLLPRPSRPIFLKKHSFPFDSSQTPSGSPPRATSRSDTTRR